MGTFKQIRLILDFILERFKSPLLDTGYVWEIIGSFLNSEVGRLLYIEFGIAKTLTNKEPSKTDKDVYRIAESKIGIEPELLDKPMTDG